MLVKYSLTRKVHKNLLQMGVATPFLYIKFYIPQNCHEYSPMFLKYSVTRKVHDNQLLRVAADTLTIIFNTNALGIFASVVVLIDTFSR